MKFLPVAWEEVHRMSLILARKVVESGYRPEVVVGILRGGFIVARIIADVLGTETLGVVEVKFYRGIGERAERPVVTQPLVLEVRDKEVLIVDDVVDSGRTLEIVSQQVRLRGAKRVKSAALFVKPKSIINPDYYVVKTDKWILFPWEICEVLRENRVFNKDDALQLLRKIGVNISDDLLDLITDTLRILHQKRSL